MGWMFYITLRATKRKGPAFSLFPQRSNSSNLDTSQETSPQTELSTLLRNRSPRRLSAERPRLRETSEAGLLLLSKKTVPLEV